MYIISANYTRYIHIAFWVMMALCCMFGTIMSQNYDPWYFQTDTDVRFLIPDKAQHFYGSQLLSSKVGPVKAIACGVLWELLEARMGDFVSGRDLIADVLGVIASRLDNKVSALRTTSRLEGDLRLWIEWDKERGEIMLKLGVRL